MCLGGPKPLTTMSYLPSPKLNEHHESSPGSSTGIIEHLHIRQWFTAHLEMDPFQLRNATRKDKGHSRSCNGSQQGDNGVDGDLKVP